MPGYGISESEEGLLPWTWAVERLGASHNYWIGTVRPNGRPHTMPIWGVWMEGRFYFSTARTSRKASNLGENSNCVVCTEHGAEAVIVEGEAEIISDADVLRPAWEAYKAKYNWDVAGESMFVVRPRTAFAFIEAPDEFAGKATRWQFG
jgi:nitroimidazol reductase NimA-like FMN-containing flavoprotein (pyridoxamine 5'-phosphate oxidase superfamily)